MEEPEYKNECPACKDPFEWDHEVVLVNDALYHTHCVDLYPTGYVAFLNGEYLGETDNDDGDNVCEYIPELFGDNDDDE